MENNEQNQEEREEIDDLELQTEEIKDEEEEKTEEKREEEKIVVPKAKILLIKNLLENIKENNDQIIKLLSVIIPGTEEERISIAQASDDSFAKKSIEEQQPIDGRIIEGVFDGESMIGPDGKHYSVPANYASKSKLVEGDTMKLTITPNGTFVYKQIGPIDRSRLVGELEQNTSGNFIVKVDGKMFKVLTASVTYYKGQTGDEAVILVPKGGQSNWAAVENIVRKTS